MGRAERYAKMEVSHKHLHLRLWYSCSDATSLFWREIIPGGILREWEVRWGKKADYYYWQMWLSVTENPLRRWVEDASELIHKGTGKLRYLFISSCPSLLMVTPETLTCWNFQSDYMCSAAQLTLWPENDFRQRGTAAVYTFKHICRRLQW